MTDVYTPPPRLSVELVGGPAHGEKLMVRSDRKRIDVVYMPEGDGPEVKAENGQRPVPVQVSAVVLVYLRASEDAVTAEYHDMEID